MFSFFDKVLGFRAAVQSGIQHRAEYNRAMQLKKDNPEEAFTILENLIRERPYEEQLRLQITLLAEQLQKHVDLPMLKPRNGG